MKTPTLIVAGLLAGICGPALAQGIENTILGSAADKPLRLDAMPGSMSSNLMDGARIGLTGLDDRSAIVGSALAVLDGNKRSSLQFDADGQAAVEIRFYGAPRFINTIEIETDSDGIAVEVLTPRGEWVAWKGAVATRSATGQIVSGEDVRAAGFRFIPQGRGPVRFSHVHGDFRQVDADQGTQRDGGGRSILTEWVENYTTSPLPNTSEDAQGLRDALGSDWRKRSWGNSNAWEEDFTSSVYGGNNSNGLDAHDLTFFSGHGGRAYGNYYSTRRRSLVFSNSTHDDTDCTAGDARRCWGNEDCEWVGLSACETMKDSSRWAWAMNGLHLVLGWDSIMYDTPHFGSRFGQWMVRDGWFDSPRTVLHSWCLAGEDTHNSGQKIKVIGETTSMGSDYLWGQGSVAADPTGNGIVKTWTWNTQDNPRTVSDAPLDRAAEFKGGSSLVRISPELLAVHAGRQDRTMPVWSTDSKRTNAGALAEQAARIMAFAGRGDRFDVGPDAKVNSMIAVGADLEVRRSIKTGAIRVEDLGFWGERTDAVPVLPRSDVAIARSKQALAAIGIAVRADDSASIEYFTQETVEAKEDGSDRVIDRVHLAIRVNRQHTLGAYEAWGPGASTSVTFGDEGELVSMKSPAFDAAAPAGSVKLRSLTPVLRRIAEEGAAASINGLRAPFDSLQVDQVELGYWMDGNIDCDQLRPVYKLSCTCMAGDDAFTAELFVPASEESPRLQIQVVGDGRVDWNEAITLQARTKIAAGGSTIAWFDDSGACIGKGPEIKASWSTPTREGVRLQTVEARVTDGHGRTTSSHLDIPLGNAGDLDASGHVSVDDLLLVLKEFRKDVSPWTGGDADGSGNVDARDLVLVLANWGGRG